MTSISEKSKNWSIVIKNPGIKRHKTKFTLAFVLLAAACTIPGQTAKYDSNPQIAIPQKWASYSKSEPVLKDDTWLKSFRNSQLIKLVDEALANNRDLKVAAARTAEARAIARSVGSDIYPTVSATLEAGRRKPRSPDDEITSSYDVGLQTAWEVDIWGRLRSAQTGAALDAVSEEALYEYVRQSIAAQVVDTWITIMGRAALIEIANQEVNTRSKVAENINARVQEKALIAVDENWSQAELSRAKARRADAEGSLLVSTRALEVLLGRYPGANLKSGGRLPALPGRIPAGLPSELLERRPDLVAAERQVAAAFHRSGEARAARLPSVTLTANLTRPGGSLGSGLEPNNLVWGLFGNIIAPIFNGGKLKANELAANARQSQALANYGASALRAFQEVEDAMSNELYLQRQLNHLWRASQEFETAISLEGERYDLGEIDIVRLDEARIRYYAVLRDTVAAQVALLRNRVQLHLALGGSFAGKSVAKAAAK